MMMTKRLARVAVAAGLSVAAGTMLGSVTARAATISSGNSTVTLNPTNDLLPYITQWAVDGVDQYGGSPAGDTRLFYFIGSGSVVYVNSLPVMSSSFSGGNASVTYQTTGVTITVKDVLTGGSAGSGKSELDEQLDFTNTSSSAIALDFAHFINLNLDAMPNTDSLTFGPSMLEQSNPLGTDVKINLNPAAALISVSTNGDAGPYFDVAPPGPFTGDIAVGIHMGTIDETTTNIAAGSTAVFNVDETLSGVASSQGAAVPLPNSAAAALTMLAVLGLIRIAKRGHSSFRECSSPTVL
ncbi:MAG: hypothetical protein ABSH08_09375 [Tepidisphaeraceae bacterium]